jgi:hypothetical protein
MSTNQEDQDDEWLTYGQEEPEEDEGPDEPQRDAVEIINIDDNDTPPTDLPDKPVGLDPHFKPVNQPDPSTGNMAPGERPTERLPDQGPLRP